MLAHLPEEEILKETVEQKMQGLKVNVLLGYLQAISMELSYKLCGSVVLLRRDHLCYYSLPCKNGIKKEKD